MEPVGDGTAAVLRGDASANAVLTGRLMMSGHGGPDSPRRRTLGASIDLTQVADRTADRAMKSAGRLWCVQSKRNLWSKITRNIRLF